MMNDLLQEKPTPQEFKTMREQAGLSGAKTAEILGLSSRQYVSQLETGKYDISPQIWTLFLLITGEHPNYTITPKTHD